MSYHTGAVGACQPPGGGATPKPPPTPADRRLVGRYGAAALDDGYVAIPRVVIRRRRALGVSAAEWDYICEVWSYWRAERLPGPSVEDLAGGLGVDQSTVRRHRASLEHKGLLRVIPNSIYNRYDLRPLIDAAVALDRAQAPDDDHDDQETPLVPASGSVAGATSGPRPSPRTSRPDDRAGLHATKKVEKKVDHDSIPPYPPSRGNARSHSDRATGPLLDDQAIAKAISSLSAELGDNAPASSISRVGTLWGNAGVPANTFLALIDEAAARTRARQDRIIARGRDGAPSGMRYFFAVLTDLLHPLPPQPRRPTAIPDRGRDQLNRWRRRDGLAGDQRGVDAYDHHLEPPPADVRREWRDTLEELRDELTADNYRRWFLPTRVLSIEGDLLRIGVPDRFHQQWLDRRLRGAVERAMARAAPGVHVTFEVEGAV